MLIENGLTGTNAVFILALLGPAQVAGRALIKIFKTKSIAHVGIFVASMFPLTFTAIFLFPAYFPLLVFAALIYGLATGTMTIVKGITVPELLTKSSYGTINGIMNAPITVLKALAPGIAAVWWGITGDYSGLLIGLVGASILMLLSFLAAALIAKNRLVNS